MHRSEHGILTNTPMVSSSESFHINESCVKDDIANLINKIYTPVEEMNGSSTDGDPSCEEFKTRKSAVINEVVCEKDNKTNKRFGYYFEAVTARNNVRHEMESNSSDSVSLPSVKNNVKSSRNICKCCRQNIHNRAFHVRGKSVCDKGKVCKHCNYYNGTLLKTTKPLLKLLAQSNNKGQGDLFTKDCSEVHHNTIKHNKSAPALICDKHTCSNQKRSFSFKKQTCFGGTSSNYPTLLRSKLKCDQQLSSKTKLSNTKSKIFEHFASGFGNWPNIFRTEKMANPIEVVHTDYNVDSKVTCKKQSIDSLKYRSNKSQLPCQFNSNPSQVPKLKRGCQSLFQNPEVIETIVGEDLNLNPVQISSNLRGEQLTKSSKLDKKTSKCQGMKEESVEHKDRVMTVESSSEENIKCKVSRVSDTQGGRKDNIESQSEKYRLNDETVVEDKGNKVSSTSRFKPLPYSPERVEFYCFDYGNTKYLQTTDMCPPLHTVLSAEKNSDWATMFWARVFGVFHIVCAFFTAFILQLLRFVLHGLVRPLLWGTVQIVSDYTFKPCLTILFSSIIQPTFILLQNVTTSFRDVCLPVAQCFGYFLSEIAVIFRACRLVEVHSNGNKNPNLRNLSA